MTEATTICFTCLKQRPVDAVGVCEECRGFLAHTDAPSPSPNLQSSIDNLQSDALICGVPIGELSPDDVAILESELAEYEQHRGNTSAWRLVESAAWAVLGLARNRREEIQLREMGGLKAADQSRLADEHERHTEAYRDALKALNALPEQHKGLDQHKQALTDLARSFMDERAKLIEQNGGIGQMSPEAKKLAEEKGLNPGKYVGAAQASEREAGEVFGEEDTGHPPSNIQQPTAK